jgi:DNA repair protein RadC
MEQLDLFNDKPKRAKRKPKGPQEFKVVALRDCTSLTSRPFCEKPDQAAAYWRAFVTTAPWYSPQQECLVSVLLSTRRRVLGHHLVGIGILDSVITHPREVFRAAVVAAAHSVLIMHNHPGGDPSPSEADIRVTRDLIRASRVLRIDILDHIVIGNPNHCSLRECGFFND